MAERRCAFCESSFYPVSDAWGEDVCGDCIAERIESLLMPNGRERKPMRRAATADERQERFADSPRKSA